MTTNLNNSRLKTQQSGQAMTEFVVSVSFVFLSLFVIVPMFGKIMDMQSQTQQASRYVAWERTVWFDDGDKPDESVVTTNADWENVAIRSDAEVMESMANRFFYGTGAGELKPITDADTKVASGDINPVWTYVQSKKTMYGGTTLGSDKDSETGRKTSLDGQLTPAIGYKVVDIINSGVSAVAKPVNQFLGKAGFKNNDFMTFAYETKNYYSPVLTTQLNMGNSHGGGIGVWDRDDKGNWGSGIEDVIFKNWDGKLKARSAILADGWNTQSLKHFQARADDFVPSTLFDNKIIDGLIKIARVLDGGPGNSAIEKLDFGAVGIEPVPSVEISESGGLIDMSNPAAAEDEILSTGEITGHGFYYYDD